MEPTDNDRSTARRMVRVLYNSFPPLSLTFSQALARDDYRCMITGMYDRESLSHCSAIASRGRICTAIIQTCHILKESTTQGISHSGIDEDSKVVNEVRFC